MWSRLTPTTEETRLKFLLIFFVQALKAYTFCSAGSSERHDSGVYLEGRTYTEQIRHFLGARGLEADFISATAAVAVTEARGRRSFRGPQVKGVGLEEL